MGKEWLYTAPHESFAVNKMSPIKTAVAAAFSAAAESYDAGADIQRLVADRLARRIKALTLPASARILEIGCGTGFLSSELTGIEAADLVITDISGAMLARCRQRLGTQSARFLVMDGENPNPAAGSGFDLICSSLAFQWFDDLSVALTRLASLLAPGGYLAFATLGAESFKEWHNAHLALQLPSAEPPPGANAWTSPPAPPSVSNPGKRGTSPSSPTRAAASSSASAAP